ncbi:hypothetical protein RhiirB3_505231 [Rhizophagus irregularis]|nr:hypothetical protein RhiirB3_505231 [Rhizophagus irregularis]
MISVLMALRSNKASTDISFAEIYNLLLYLEEDVMEIQEELGIVGYTNQEMAEEADKNAKVYLRKFEKFHGPLEGVPSVLIQKFGLFYKRETSVISEGLSSTITRSVCQKSS